MKSEFELEKVSEEPAIVYIGSELAGCIFSPEIIVSIDEKTIGKPKDTGSLDTNDGGYWYLGELRIKGAFHSTVDLDTFRKKHMIGGD